MAYLYETHLHSMEGSACGRVSGRDYVKFYQDEGYDGIFITDHFYNGNCRPDRELPWEEWVHQYCRGYEVAKEEGDRLGMKVFFGLEERFDNHGQGYDDEWLIYGLDKAYLLAHPDMRTWSRADYLKNVHEAGGCCVQAHPFRNRDYIGAFRLTLGVDAVEGYNANNKPEADVTAQLYAKKNHLVMVAGGDVHFCGSARRASGLSSRWRARRIMLRPFCSASLLRCKSLRAIRICPCPFRPLKSR